MTQNNYINTSNWWYPRVFWVSRTHLLIHEKEWKKGDQTWIHISLVHHQLDGPPEEDFYRVHLINLPDGYDSVNILSSMRNPWSCSGIGHCPTSVAWVHG